MNRPAVLKDRAGERNRFQLRLLVAVVVVLVAFGGLVARFVWLQILQHEHYQTLAESNRISILPVPPTRGLIFDRNGVVLANNYSAYTLEITPSKVSNLDETIDGLSTLVEITPKDRKRFNKLKDENKHFASLPIKVRLTDEEVAKFAANRWRFPGVEINARLFRQYPQGEVGSHFLGYIGRINTQDLERIKARDEERDYKGTDHIGKAGVEQSYERELHGVTGYAEVETDASNRAVRTLRTKAPVAGNNLVLSVDIELQKVAEKAFGSRRGALVAIEPETGGVLALVSQPGYDPNLFVDGIDPQSWKELNESPDRPLNNRALQGTYPPGSTFKPFMALAALEYNKRTPHQAFFDPGFFVLGTHRFRDDKAGGHGYVDLYRSIVVSCDTYYYMLANDLGIDNIAQFMKQFSFGQKTGIDIEGEKTGVLPSREWKAKRFKKREQQKWLLGDTVSVSIGQGYNNYTPMQLAQATAILANNGVTFKPHIVRFVENSVSQQKVAVEPKPMATIPLKRANLDVVKRALAGVNTDGTGATVFRGAPYIAAGKTGTAQVFNLKGAKYIASATKEHLRDHAWYMVFAPLDKPKIALVVLVENGGFGAQAAAPIARQVLDYYLAGKKSTEPAAEAAVESD
ncbi:penicillin-binding protein 2 [Chitinivorax tropicus]|uniref:Peptidoglycan D,D-transpeptidase MrdA n=1 Tax=Chitinivorax tropicus TaxID=714531 RepID=A0A840MRW7_9PROT|nr:penicillin-binding protein 2 [Chitinivorax tropicus]MBB5017961.1 penicillin-binding protein 2 [Chitinivorax tropicus]